MLLYGVDPWPSKYMAADGQLAIRHRRHITSGTASDSRHIRTLGNAAADAHRQRITTIDI
jgi:hypothetical protein